MHYSLKHFIWNRRSQMLLLENIELYLSSGLTLFDALQISTNSFSKKQSFDLKKIISSIEQGELFSRSLKIYVGFPETLVSLIEQGEYSGGLPRALGLARMIIEREDTLMKSCLSALAYPVIIGLFAVLLTVGLMKGVMPQIIPLLKSLNVDLPILTRMVIFFSENLTIFVVYTLFFLVFVGPLFLFLINKYKLFKKYTQRFSLRIPLVGNIYRQYQLSIMIRSIGSLIMGGVSIESAYIRVVKKINLISLKDYFLDKAESISSGVQLSLIFLNIKKIPTHVVPLIKAGEISGNLGESLTRVSDIIDRDIEQNLKRLTSLIEPIMMIGMGCIIGAVALSIMIPIYDVSKVLQH